MRMLRRGNKIVTGHRRREGRKEEENWAIKGNERGVDSEQLGMPTDRRNSEIESSLTLQKPTRLENLCLYKKERLSSFSPSTPPL